ncbi:MAG: sulfite exporter TauE/SafE family protein [Chloroflexi bacterium]|nr:MAG: sulfite exporter TauE/SafE family protein [Chloroflexota bacterium]
MTGHDLLAVLGGVLIGALSGLMGIGGGTVYVPFLLAGFGARQQVAQGTSLFAIIPTAVSGAYAHDRAGHVVRRALGWMALGGLVAAPVGALLAVHLPRDVLARLFGLLLLYSAYRMWPRRLKADDAPKPA